MSEESVDVVVTDLQYLISTDTSTASAAGTSTASAAADSKTDAASNAAAAAAHSDHRHESVRQTTTALHHNPWWEREAANLIQLYTSSKLAANEAMYVYATKQIESNIAKLKSLKNINRIFYAMKANFNTNILKLVIANGLGIECVSIDELKCVQSLGISGERILFTPNFAAVSEYQFAFDTMKCFVNLDNIFPVQAVCHITHTYTLTALIPALTLLVIACLCSGRKYFAIVQY